ncbi:MAG: 2-hydroxyacid dehydrogenase [Anaerolineae bacterium]|nr:2-hydroxyacid dehydrogenase [Anaerolineae bacterium]
MKVAILGDLFLTNEVLQKALEKAFEGSGVQFETVYQTDSWPVTPVMKTDEVSEFVGDENEVCKVVGDVEIILTHTAPITQKVLAVARNLKVVGAARGGPVNINWKACTERGIPVLYAPGRNSGAVAEFTVGMMLAQSRNITRSHMSMMTEKRWRGDLYTLDVVGKELNSSVVGLVGSGAIGGKVAHIVRAFGARVLIYDPYIPAEKIKEMGGEPVELETLLKECDFISLHARLTKETRGMIGEREIQLMKPTAYLINTARGELVDHNALYKALKEKRLAGAALDIFESEPPPDDSPLYLLDNVTVTSHLAGASLQAAEIGARVLAEGVFNYIYKQETPRYCVNPDYIEHKR